MRRQRHLPAPAPARKQRRAITLLIVITMLGLFAVAALGFVYYAQSEATAARYSQEATTLTRADVEPEQVFAFVMGQLLYGPPNNDMGYGSSFRGHDLATNAFGVPFDPIDPSKLRPATMPFNGVGRVNYNYGATDPAALNGKNDRNLVHYKYFSSDGFLRDPGYLGTRAGPTQPLPTTFVNGLNPPYTYPDHNHLFLAALDAEGQVRIQSFHRDWLGVSLDPNATDSVSGKKIWVSASNDPASAANPAIKYQTLRPLPSLHSGFPPPEDGGGDVKNLPFAKGVPNPNVPGTYYNNDSIWIDPNFPILNGPNGLRYKVLVAPLIIDLDGKININAHGNVKGTADPNSVGAHVSNQGWGVWAVNLGKVLDDTNVANEWQNVLKGNGTVQGRYGADLKPQGGTGVSGNDERAPPFYGRVDFDGYDETDDTIRWQLPGEGAGTAFTPFANFPDSRYQNNDITSIESTNHPLLFNYFNQYNADATKKDRVFHDGHLEALLRYGDTGSPALTSELFRLLPNNFANDRRRRMVTTHSIDFARPGMMPWLENTAGAAYTYDAGLGYPKADAANYNLVTSNQGEFGGTAQSVVAALGRLDINRSLTKYPSANIPALGDMDATDDYRITDTATFQTAQQERQQLAKEIFDRLAWVTMGRRPYLPMPTDSTLPEYKTLRWLAQLAVNIVDYRDDDQYITPFQWSAGDTDTTHPDSGYVFGTELPQVLLNEAYVEIANHHMENLGGASASMDFHVNFWLELLNPLKTDANLAENGAARLQVPETAANANDGWPVYKIVAYKTPTAANDPLLRLNNVTGDPNPPGEPMLTEELLRTDAMVTPAQVAGGVPDAIEPADGAFKALDNKTGFYLVGPKDVSFPGANVPPQPALQVAHTKVDDAPDVGLTYALDNGANPDDFDDLRHTILLRRLACPHLEPQENPAQPLYNPYITVDVMENVFTNDTVKLAAAPRTPPQEDVKTRKAQGRWQPYAGHRSLLKDQADDETNGMKKDQPRHTFGRHNLKVDDLNVLTDPSTITLPTDNYDLANQLALPFDWLVHPDRQLISPVELLHVSAYPPHRLTERFMEDRNSDTKLTFSPVPEKFIHTAHWFRNDARLYRFLETIQTASRASGSLLRGLEPGKMNINTIWDQQVFEALCDRQAHSSFTDAQVTDIWKGIQQRRTASTAGVPGATDQPFWGLATPHVIDDATDTQFPQGFGIQNTILRASDNTENETQTRLFEPPLDLNNPEKNPADPKYFTYHPYRRFELMTKIFGNTTTRSNVFAVWLTVGFFEVDPADETKLGPEIGRAENRHVRHRMFAIVDRTQIGLLPAELTATSGGAAVTLGADITDTGVQQFTLSATSGTVGDPTSPPAELPAKGYTWSLYDGMGLVINRGQSDEETIIVSWDGTTAEAHFTKPHTAAGSKVSLVGTEHYSYDNAGNPIRSGYVYGHPGPQANFDPRNYPAVVRYFTVIE